MDEINFIRNILLELDLAKNKDINVQLDIFTKIFEQFNTDIGKKVLQNYSYLRTVILNKIYDFSLVYGNELKNVIAPFAADKITIHQMHVVRDTESFDDFEEEYLILNKKVNDEENKIFQTLPEYKENTFSIINKYSDILKNISSVDMTILQKSNEDAVIKIFDASNSIKNEYIIKVASTTMYKAEFNQHLHEAFVALVGGINDLRNYIPNFAQVYGITNNKECPLIDLIYSAEPNSDRFPAFAGNLNFKYDKCFIVVYEYIKGPTLHKFLRSIKLESNVTTTFKPILMYVLTPKEAVIITMNDIKNIFLQLFYALYEAYKRKKFTHYDLHQNNIIVSPIKSQEKITYLAGELQIDKFKVVIIDYGSSHIEYEGKHYGRVYNGGIRNIQFWIHDVFKILMYIYKVINHDLVFKLPWVKEFDSILINLLKFFITDPSRWLSKSVTDMNWYGVEPFFFSKSFEEFLEHAKIILA